MDAIGGGAGAAIGASVGQSIGAVGGPAGESGGLVAGFAAMTGGVGALAAAASAGEFEVNEAGGRPLLDSIDRQLRWISDNDWTLGDLRQPYRLGTSHAATVMAPYIQGVYGGGGGLGRAIAQYREALITAREAISTAMRNYQNTEERNRRQFPEEAG